VSGRVVALLVRRVVNVAFVVGDEDALSFALKEARLAHDALRTVHGHGLFASELELGPDARVVNDFGELIPGFKLKNVDRTDVPTMGAPRALSKIDIDLNHRRFP
jgi:hypothetical protein